MAEQSTTILTTGRRKESVARVFLVSGTGKVTVNKRALDDFFKIQTLRTIVLRPFEVTKTTGKFDVRANVSGGGTTGQAGAIRLGISRALASMDEAYKKTLRNYGFLTRDSRAKERKKYGQKRARKKFQYTKR